MNICNDKLYIRGRGVPTYAYLHHFQVLYSWNNQYYGDRGTIKVDFLTIDRFIVEWGSGIFTKL